MCTPPRGLRGWGCPRRAAGPSVPLSADTVSRPPPPPPWLGWGSSGAPACGEKRRGFELAPRPRAFRGRCLPPSRASSRRKRSLGGCWPLGLVVGGWGTVSRHVAGVGGPRWVVWAVWGRVAGPPSFHRPALGGRCPLASGRPRAPPALPPPHASAVPSFPAARPRSEPASRPPPLSPPPVGTGGSRPRPSPCAHPRPGDACPGGDPRDAAASARRCALSPRAVAVPRLAPPSPPLREGVACGGGGGGKGTRGCAVRLSPVLGFGVRARPNPPPPALPRPPLRRAPAPSVP